MGFDREEIYRKRSERLTKLLEDRGIKNKAFTNTNMDLPPDADTFAPSYISSLKHGKKHLTEEVGQRLIDLVLKDVRLDYLMCKDNWVTETDKALAMASKENYEMDTRFHGLKLFMENYGYFLMKGATFPRPDNVSQEEADHLIQENTTYMVYKGEDFLFKVDPDNFDALCTYIKKGIELLFFTHLNGRLCAIDAIEKQENMKGDKENEKQG